MSILSLSSASSVGNCSHSNQVIRKNFSLPEECQQINVKEKLKLENNHYATIDSAKYYQWMHKSINRKG